MNEKNDKRVKLACYTTFISVAIVTGMSAILFMTFREKYNISFTQLGTLVLINFFTQLLMDLVFTFFAEKFSVEVSVKITPLLNILGFIIYGLIPLMLPEYAYLGIVVGTIIFSIGSGLNEVLISPVVAAIPSENPGKDMTKLHSVYAWGVVAFVIVGTVFLKIVGANLWYLIPFISTIFPFVALILFLTSKLPVMNKGIASNNNTKGKIPFNIILCTIIIFLGAMSECTMMQWSSSFIENALGIPKVVGDILGMAAFAATFGLGRTLYAKRGKDVLSALTIGMIGSFICYTIIGVSSNEIVSLIACIFLGFFVSMLWPGVIVLVGQLHPTAGVATYALMAAAGDLGGSLGPQMVGIIIDNVTISSWAQEFSYNVGLTAEQLGMHLGILAIAAFPLIGALVLIFSKKHLRKKPY